MPFSQENGLYGLVKLSNDALAGSGKIIMATGGSIDLSHEPLVSTGLWGAGYSDAATTVAYSANVVTVEGSVDFELTYEFWDELDTFSGDRRAHTDGTWLSVKPNGQGGFDDVCWCTGINFSASEGAIVSGGFNWASDKTGSVTNTAGTARQTHVTGSVNDNVGAKVYPYWGTGITGSSTEIIDWSASMSSPINFVTLCTKSTAAPAAPSHILVGTMDSDGSYTAFGLAGPTTAALLQTATTITFEMNPADATANIKKVTFPKLIYNSASPPITSGGDYISVGISWTGIGDGTNAPMYLHT